jgi:MOSC domain-containing protein YiiM
MAVYAYPSEHYAYWRAQLPNTDLPCGAFGENFSTAGLSEDSLCIGDRLHLGSAEFAVTQPRLPCFKLGLRFGRADMVKRFLRSGRLGFYLAVLREGDVTAGDAIQLHRGGSDVTVAEIARLYTSKAPDPDAMRRASELPALPESWRGYFRERLESSGA